MKPSLVAVFLLAIAAPALAPAQERIHCSSREFRDNYCPADTRAGVEIIRQTSRAPCEEGRSWGYDRRGVWVTGGCEAEFLVGARRRYDDGRLYDDARRYDDRRYDDRRYDDRRYDDRDVRWRDDRQYGSRDNRRYGKYGGILCESRDYRYRHCAIGGGREVELVRQVSKSECRYGATWGHDRGGVWVDRGCAAEFAVR
ncbi:MAG TPA: DUF3011 domain-containing protein [Candidatus Saccharimonadia bacterium]|nr:DUF3011 domain-containing protein [Candidatus Saccharimonadia bacterium]